MRAEPSWHYHLLRVPPLNTVAQRTESPLQELRGCQPCSQNWVQVGQVWLVQGFSRTYSQDGSCSLSESPNKSIHMHCTHLDLDPLPQVSCIVICFLQIPKENQRSAHYKSTLFNQLMSALTYHHSGIVELVCSFISTDRKLAP